MSTVEFNKLPNNDVCARCKKIPWDELARPCPVYKEVMGLDESHEQLKTSRCRICRCLAKIKPSSLDGRTCQLMQCSERSFYFQDPKEESDLISGNLLYISKKKYGALGLFKSGHHYDIGIQPTDPNNIPFADLRKCKAHCQRSHYLSCFQKRSSNSSISNLRVIDCLDPMRKVNQAPTKCKYVALSYVWGNISNSSSTQYPRVVEDAIVATLSMELQYLWVDAYCIDQTSSSDKHHQISQMGAIYANSEITFVAAAGADMTHGLPGVSRPRRQQGTETIDGVTLLEAFPHPFYSVNESVWASRAWTFQEAFFSPRRLIFTDNGVLFLCNRMCIAEWEKRPLYTIHPSSAWLFHAMTPFAGHDSNRPMEISENDAKSMLREYSRRQLSYESDALNACLGILKMLEKLNLYSVWGVLIERRARNPQLMIYWYHKTPTSRRPGFPSWSYLGWEGQFDMYDGLEYRNELPLLQVSIGDGEKPYFGMKLNRHIIQLLKGLGEEAPRYLHLEGPMVDVKLEDIQWTDGQKSHQIIKRDSICDRHRSVDRTPPSELYASFEISAGIRMLVRAYIDEADLHPRKVVGAFYHADVDRRKARVLLFGDHGEYYERIGALDWDFGDTSGFRSLGRKVIFVAESGEKLDEVKIDGNESLLIERRTIVVK